MCQSTSESPWLWVEAEGLWQVGMGCLFERKGEGSKLNYHGCLIDCYPLQVGRSPEWCSDRG